MTDYSRFSHRLLVNILSTIDWSDRGEVAIGVDVSTELLSRFTVTTDGAVGRA